MKFTRTDAALVGFAVVTAGLLYLGVTSGHPAPAPDATPAACALWADEATPTLPPGTPEDRCTDTDGTLVYAPVIDWGNPTDTSHDRH